MKEFITIIVSFLVVVALAFYMYISAQKHSIAVLQSKELQLLVEKNNEELKNEIQDLREHIKLMDSLYHK